MSIRRVPAASSIGRRVVPVVSQRWVAATQSSATAVVPLLSTIREVAAPGKSTGQGGGEGSVGQVHLRSWGASLECGELVAQDQDFDLLCLLGSGKQGHPAEELGGQ